MSNDYGSGYRDGKRYAQFEVHVEIQKKQKEIDVLVEALMKEKREHGLLCAALCEYVATVVEAEGVSFIDRMPTPDRQRRIRIEIGEDV